ncbi:TGL2 [Candida oxycetoniae]|uniref:TGL2 n=1 Tax=Candida oxycetoniae TaxID=497107 RepID=A0AAI9SVL4_9ASCO|nr:TGL2 [Candida oxycetoniae]KAI3403888.2 TGL2 [Candida oxycetoniae]
MFNLLRCYSTAARATCSKDLYITAKYRELHKHYDAPKYPLVLCHGFSGFDKFTLLAKPQLAVAQAVDTAKESLDSGLKEEENVNENAKKRQVSVSPSPSPSSLVELNYWNGIKEALEKLGSTVFIAKVPAFGNIETRATSLDKFITKQCKVLRKHESKQTIYQDEKQEHTAESYKTFKQKSEPIKINLISHSMGGLDSRYLISKIHKSNKIYKVASLTTISTPHHGSEVADFIVEQVEKHPSLKLVCPKSIYELTTTQMKEFNKAVPNDPSVEYFSFGAKFNPKWFNLFNLTWHIMRHQILKNAAINKGIIPEVDDKNKLTDNDGLVSVESSKWGNYAGTLDNVDHLDLINWTNRARLGLDKIMWAKQPPFNPIALYLDVADKLAHRGL